MASILRGSYSSIVEVYRNTKGMLNGAPSYSFQPLTTIIDSTYLVPGQMACRLDLGWLKPGAQAPEPVEAGMPMPRVGTLFFDLLDDGTMPLLANDHLKVLSGPITGIFQLRIIPEPAQDIIGIALHAEVQVVEVSIATLGVFPGVEVI